MPNSDSARNHNRNITLAVTGASGSIFAGAMLRLLAHDHRVAQANIVVSDSALRVLAEEMSLHGGRAKVLETLLQTSPAGQTADPVSPKFILHQNTDVGAGIASGSYPSDGMVVLPCSMGTLAAISHGLANNLIERAADVCLKERRPLILCVRETPFHLIHLRNMAQATEAGATIFPVIPAFYNRPDSLAEIATQFCCRVLAHLGLQQQKAFQWKAEPTVQTSAVPPAK